MRKSSSTFRALMVATSLALAAACAPACAKRDRPLWNGWKLAQRSSLQVPGLGGEVAVSVGDIRAGYLPSLSISGRHGGFLASGTLGIGESLPFAHDGRRFELTVLGYERHTLGQDYMFIDVRERPRAAGD